MSSYVESTPHTSSVVSFTLTCNTRDTGYGSETEAYFTMPPIFDRRYNYWQVSCDIVMTGAPVAPGAGPPTRQWAFMMSPTVSGGPVTPLTAGVAGNVFSYNAREQIVAGVRHWGDQNNEMQPEFMTTRTTVFNPSGQRLLIRLADPYDNFSTIDVGHLFDPVLAPNGGANYWTLVFSASPILNQTLITP